MEKTLDEVIKEAMAENQSQDSLNGDTQSPSETLEEKVPEVNNSEEETVQEPSSDLNSISDEELAEAFDQPQDVSETVEPTAPTEEFEKTLTQSQANELIGKARREGSESALKKLLAHYGVNDENELNGVFGKGQAYDLLSEDYASQSKQLSELQAENALLKSNINRDRWDDAKAILANKAMDITVDNILAMAKTHPEWITSKINGNSTGALSPNDLDEMVKNKQSKEYAADSEKIKNEQPATIKKFGADVEAPSTEDNQAWRKYFNL